MNDFITSAACSAGAILLAGWARCGTTGAGFWYSMMSICLLGMALIYAAWWVVELAEELAENYRKKHRRRYGKITRDHARREEPEYRQDRRGA